MKINQKTYIVNVLSYLAIVLVYIQISEDALSTDIVLIATIPVLMVFLFIQAHLYQKRENNNQKEIQLLKLEIKELLKKTRYYEIATTYRVPEPNEVEILTDSNNNFLKLEGISDLSIKSLNRFDTPSKEDSLLWISSWIGAQNGSIIESVIVKENNSNTKLTGKVPVKEIYDNSQIVSALKFNFSHKKNGWWTASINGEYGKATLGDWKTINILDFKSLTFRTQWTEASKSKLSMYVKFKDINGNSSNLHLFQIFETWKTIDIDIWKFFRNKLIRDHKHLKPIVDSEKKENEISPFNPKLVYEVNFGHCESMENESGIVYLHNLKLT